MINKPDLIMSTSLFLYFYKINQGNYCDIVMSNTIVIYCGILTLGKVGNSKLLWYFNNIGPWCQKIPPYLTLEKDGTMVNYYGIFIT